MRNRYPFHRDYPTYYTPDERERIAAVLAERERRKRRARLLSITAMLATTLLLIAIGLLFFYTITSVRS